MIARFDHCYGFLKDNNLENTLEKYARAGFIVSPKRIKHPGGHLNGFITLTGTYLEFVSIHDEKAFETESQPEERDFRKKPRPMAAAAVIEDPAELYKLLAQQYPTLKKDYIRFSSENPNRGWHFVDIPKECAPGGNLFGLKYLGWTKEDIQTTPTKNTIYALGGLIFCSQHPSRVNEWEKFLKLTGTNTGKVSNNEIGFGFQKLTWLSPESFEESFDTKWDLTLSTYSEIAGVHLLATDLDTAEDFLKREFKVKRRNHELYVSPCDNDGLAMIVRQEQNLSAKHEI